MAVGEEVRVEVGAPARDLQHVQQQVRQQYELWPYPAYPWFAKVRPHTVWQLHAGYLASRCGLPTPPGRARIWIAGCGTFQPHVFATANPDADILATDLSRASLRRARRRCLWHGQRHVSFAPVDLGDPRTLPDGPFDLIECYGVLMCLPDPGATLRALAARLAPHGVLRLMVYPRFGRQRIFQLQRAAKLLGLHHRDRQHPRRLRRLVAALPPAHPLRYAFVTYEDARTDAGLADAFLHPFDRGFTGLELGAMVRAAGLEPAFFFQRPWAQPATMGRALGFGDRDPFAVLHYLDLWQELRGNFVVCLRRRQRDAGPQPLRVHPLFDARTPGLDMAHRARVLWARLAGLRLEDRTRAAAHVLTGRTLRQARTPDDDARRALVEAGVLLTPQARDAFVALGCAEVGEPDRREPGADPGAPLTAVWRGARVPNPLYAHLFAAYATENLPGLPQLGACASQVERWRPHSEPLEDARVPHGLTPVRTYDARREQVEATLSALTRATPTSWTDARLRDEGARVDALRRLLLRAELSDHMPADPVARRELAVLLGDPAPLHVDVA